MSFRFKQFSVEDDLSSMKVGTDAVLLGSWVCPGNAAEILDIGTGCGVIALMMAQKSKAQIKAIDIDGDSARQAAVNFENSPWHHRLAAFHCSFQDFARKNNKKFDLVVANPPYFNDSLKSLSKKRTLARHNDLLSVEDLLSGVAGILNNNGKFFLIIPAENALSFLEEAEKQHLYLINRLQLISKPGFVPKRNAMGFGLSPVSPVIEEEIVIRNHDGTFTDACREMTREFYLDV